MSFFYLIILLIQSNINAIMKQIGGCMVNIEKLIKILNNEINGITENFTISDDEFAEMRDLLHKLNYLYCFPDDRKFFNYPLITSALKENKFFCRNIYPNDQMYTELMNEPLIVQHFQDNGIVEASFTENEYSTNICNNNIIYQKQNNSIEEYRHFVPNDDMHIEMVISYNNIDIESFNAPLQLSEEKKEELINAGKLISNDNCEYIFSINHPIFRGRRTRFDKNIPLTHKSLHFINQFILSRKIHYLDIDGDLVLKHTHLSGDRAVFKEVHKKLSKFLIIDYQGNELDTSQQNASDVFYDIRNAISHCNDFDFKVKTNHVSFRGKVFLINDTDQTGEFKKAVICPEVLLEPLMHSYCYNANPNDTHHHFIYYPPIRSKITNAIEAQNFQNECKILKIHTSGKTDRAYLKTMLLSAIEEFNKSNDQNLKEFILCYLKDDFSIVSLDILNIENQKWLNQQFVNNKIFYNLPLPNTQVTQNLFVEDILYNYFDPECFTAQYMQKTQNDLQLKMLPYGFNLIVTNIISLIKHHKDKTKNAPDTFNYFQAYKSEVYYIMCLIVAYNNLIKNGYAENFDYNNIQTNLTSTSNLINQIKKTSNSYERQLETENMKNFEMYELTKRFNGKGLIPEDIQQKSDVIRFIRNAICHSNIYLKFNNSSNHEDNYIIFYSVNLSKTQPDNIVRIKCKDFIEFCMRPKFKDYINPKNLAFTGSSVGEIINQVANTLKLSLEKNDAK